MAVSVIHPGEHLAEELETLDMSAAELARRLDVPTNRITQILNGTRAITGDTALRLAHFFGPGEGMDKFVTRTVRACLDGAELKLTRGEQRREFIFIDDVVRAFDFVLRFTPESCTADDVYAGSGNPIRIRDLAEQIHRLSGSLGRLRFGAVPLRKGEPIEFERPDVEPLERFGWYATVELQNGLEQVVQFEQNRRVNPCACW